MRSCLLEFEKRIGAVRRFLDGQLLELALLSQPAPPPAQGEPLVLQPLRDFQANISAFRLEKAELDYKTVIVSLYGALESFVENLAVDYLTFLNHKIRNYIDLPEKIRLTHERASATLILNTIYP